MVRRIILLLQMLQICWSRQDFFTATSELYILLDTQKIVVDILNAYVKQEEKRLHVLKRNYNIHNQVQEKAHKDILDYLENPINAFTLIKSLATGLKEIQSNIKEGIKRASRTSLRYKHVQFPTLEDLKGAALGLIRLQVIYNFEIHDLTQGIFNDTNSSSLFSSDDCFEIGRVLFNVNVLDYALLWMFEAHKIYKKLDQLTKKTLSFTDNDILEYIDKCRDNRQPLSLTHTSSREPKTQMLAQNFMHDEINHYINDELDLEKKLRMYKSLCRGETNVSPSIIKKLKCWLSTKYHPFLKYARIKVEQIYNTPNIYIFHDVIFDSEIQQIKSIAKAKLKRSLVSELSDGMLLPSEIRISKTASLLDKKYSTMARISQRISDITGLDMMFAEEFQVINYGIGGYYAPHYDFAPPGGEMEKMFKTVGNRIATVLLYLTDVHQGGATIFINLGLSVFPKKGAALIWPNLHQSGDCDWDTLHAACPVIRGSKWVCTKWIHEAGQELIRPCPLKYQPT